ncbi:butyryl-CoA:acetate CoA-transferase [Oscillibacter sp. PC13]|uniref:butyryl-CoA:acetate CoA-transferase n=1 Tax=Oscillibacter sp. PC13 TaxID=1855299 RepID=UPI0008EE6E05|nr:butyryl-CoA:acetate CoA-transferase [Oscillibacter sp. PC13]SFP12310.1 butyryl-CoA:acetate CoA-transferase [Oscillibacter sp. PC13]
MSFQEEYKQKLTTADEAVKCVQSGMWVDYGFCTGTPVALDEALARRAEELTDVNVYGGILVRRPAIADVPDAAKHFSWNSVHMSGIERKMIKEGLAFYLPIRYSELPSYYRCGNIAPDVAMIQVAPMDEHGWFNFGPNGSHIKMICEHTKKLIVEVNRNMPICWGGYDNCVHIDDVDMVVEGENPPMGLMGGAGEPSEVDLAVANLVVPEIPNGACLQLGIGSMPGAIGKMIAESDLKDLGVHTEMYVDAFVEMSEAGRITGARKPFDRGRQVYAFAAGSQKLYDFLNNNPECACVPVDYANDVARISQIDNFVSINGAVDIDLYGQVSSESSGINHISGAGGQQDFVLGAYLSKGGKSFICVSSTVKDKKTGELKSRIRPTLVEGSVVTATRTNLHWLVTEYGKLNVKGLTTWERAEGLINIAHPQFREQLIAEAEKMHIWRRSNKK